MKTEFYINGKKVSRKSVEAKVGKDRLLRMESEAKETFMEDPFIANDWMIPGGMLTIKFN